MGGWIAMWGDVDPERNMVLGDARALYLAGMDLVPGGQIQGHCLQSDLNLERWAVLPAIF